MSSNVINGPSCLASKAHQERKHGFTQLTRSTANSARLYSVILLPPRFKMAPVHESWDLTVPVQGLNNFPMDSLPTQYLFCWKAVGEGKHASHEHLMHQQICLDAHQRRSNKELFFSFFFSATINDFQDVAATGRFRSNYLLLHCWDIHWKKFCFSGHVD